MKEKDSIYVNKVNESSKSNEFFSDLNATQARNLILEFIGFDIKEAFSDYLDKDEIALREMKNTQIEIVKNISILEANLNKIATALQDNFLASNPELLSVKELIENELFTLKNSHREVSQKIKMFETKNISDSGVDTGDKVKIKESGDIATVQTINSSRGTITVTLENGETRELSSDKYESAEAAIDKSNDSNEEDGEKKKD